MKRFKAKVRCPKCGGRDIEASYVRYRGECELYMQYWLTDRDPNEHIRRTCKRCQYEWNEAVLKKAT